MACGETLPQNNLQHPLEAVEMLRASHLSQLPSCNGVHGCSQCSATLLLTQPCSQRKPWVVTGPAWEGRGPWGHVGAAALAIPCRAARRRSACREIKACIAQLTNLSVLMRFKATLPAQRKRAQAVGCPVGNPLEPGVSDGQRAVQLCTLLRGGSTWLNRVLLGRT